jgi:hypothetical protein
MAEAMPWDNDPIVKSPVAAMPWDKDPIVTPAAPVAKLPGGILGSTTEPLDLAGTVKTARESGVTGPVSNLEKGIAERTTNLLGSGVRGLSTISDSLYGIDKWIDDTIGGPASGQLPSPEEVKNVAQETAKQLETVDYGFDEGDTWDDVKAAPASKFLPWAVKQGFLSAPDMAMAMMSLPGYAAVRAGSMGQQRAVNDERENATAEDVLKVLPAAAVSGMLDKFGANKMFGLDEIAAQGLKDILKETGKAAATEGATEAAQEVVEDAGTDLGTKKGFDVAQTLENAGAAGLAGGVFGGTVRGTTSSAEVTRGKTVDPSEPPAVEPVTQDGEEEVAPSPSTSPSVITPIERAVLRKISTPDEDIDLMSRDEIDGLMRQARDARVNVDRAEQDAAAQYEAARSEMAQAALADLQTPEAAQQPAADPSTAAKRMLNDYAVRKQREADMNAAADQRVTDIQPQLSSEVMRSVYEGQPRNPLQRPEVADTEPSNAVTARRMLQDLRTRQEAEAGKNAQADAVVDEVAPDLDRATRRSLIEDGSGVSARGPSNANIEPTNRDIARQKLQQLAGRERQASEAVSAVEPDLEAATAGSLAADNAEEENIARNLDGPLAARVQRSLYEDAQRQNGDGSRTAPVRVEAPEDIDVAAQRVNTEPSDAQKEAGNYSHGHIKVGGIDIAIENPKGSERSGTDPNGRQWKVKMPAHYGRIKRTTGADGDQIDVYVGPNPQSKRVYVIDQKDLNTRRFDEHKAIMGANSVSEARALYSKAFSDKMGNDRIGGIKPMSVSEFRKWMATEDTTKPVAMGKPAVRTNDAGFPIDAKGKVKKPDSLVEFIARKGGVKDVTGELKSFDLGQRKTGFVVGAGPVLRPNGMHPDKAREAAAEAGYLPQDSTVADFYDAIDKDIRSNRESFSQYDDDWSEAWRAERGDPDADASAQETYEPKQAPDRGRDAVFTSLVADDIAGTHGDAFSKRVWQIMQDGNAYENAVELAYVEALDDLASVHPEVAALDIPFFEVSDEVQPKATPEGRKPVEQAGSEDIRSEAESRSGAVREARQGDRETQREVSQPKHADGPQQAPQRVSEDRGPEGKPQLVIPGAERASDKTMAQRKADAPLKPSVAQKDAGGLFSDEMDQKDLLDLSLNPDAVADLSGEEVMTFTGSDDMAALRAAATRWYDQNLRGTTAVMPDGNIVHFSRKGMGKATSNRKGDVLLRSVPAIRAIIERGSIVLDEPGNREGIKRRVVISAPVRFAGKIRQLAVSVHETANGSYHYDFNFDREAGVNEGGKPGVTPGGSAPEWSLPSLEGPQSAADASPINLFEWTEKSNAPAGWDFADAGEATRLSADEQKRIVDIVRTVGGTDTKFFDRINIPAGHEGLKAWAKTDASTAAGFYSALRDIVGIALDSGTVRTAYHESFHRLQNLFLNTREKALLHFNEPLLRQMIAQDGKFPESQVEGMSIKEVEAEAFSIWATSPDRARVHVGIRRVWDKIKQIADRVRNYLNGRGYQTLDDVFGKAASGEVAKRETASNDHVTDDAQFALNPQTVARAPNHPQSIGVRIKNSLSAPKQSLASRYKDKLGNKYDRHTADDNESANALFHRKFIDYLDPVKRGLIDRVGGNVNDMLDPFLTARLSEGTTRYEIQQIDDKYVTPAVNELKGTGVNETDLSNFMYAMHAPERNRVVGLRNEPGSQLHNAATDPAVVGASGMSTNEARRIIRDAQQDPDKYRALQRATAHIRAMIDESLRRQLRAGLISQPSYDELTTQWKNYVPLRAEADSDIDGSTSMPSKSRGFDVRGDEFKAATGRLTKADNVVVYAINQSEQSIIREEKNKVGQAALRFVNQYDPKGTNEIAEVYWSDDPQNIMSIDKAAPVYKRELDKDGKVVSKKVNGFHMRDDVIATKIGGKTYYVQFKDPKVGLALRKMTFMELDAISKMVKRVSNWQSLINTRANPVFVARNLFRDVQTAGVLALSRDFNAKQAASIVGNVPRAWGALWRQARGKPGAGAWDQTVKEFMKSGGKISFDQYNDIEGTMKKLQKDFTRTAGGRPGIKAWRNLVKFIEDANDMIENGTRVAVFNAARKRGDTPARAAFLARDLTVDFQKKGEYSPTLNSWYTFFNAAVQGNYNFAKAMKDSRSVKVVLGGMMLGGFVQHLFNLMAGDDDDGENAYLKMLRNKPWELERNVVFFIPGTNEYIKFPLGFGMNAFWHLGVQGGAVTTGDKGFLASTLDSSRVALDAFNPLGSGGWLEMLSPSITDPALELIKNENFGGNPIYPQESAFDPAPPPKSHQAYGSTSPVFKWMAETMNAATGGNKIEPGAIDVYPDAIEHMWGWFTGGIGRFASQTIETGQRGIDAEFEPTKTPFVRDFYGQIDASAHKAEYYDQREKVQYVKGKLKEYQDAGTDEDINRFMENHDDDVRAIPIFDVSEKQRRKLNKSRRRIEAAPMDEARRNELLKQISEQEETIMHQARQQYFKTTRDN